MSISSINCIISSFNMQESTYIPSFMFIYLPQMMQALAPYISRSFTFDPIILKLPSRQYSPTKYFNIASELKLYIPFLSNII